MESSTLRGPSVAQRENGERWGGGQRKGRGRGRGEDLEDGYDWTRKATLYTTDSFLPPDELCHHPLRDQLSSGSPYLPLPPLFFFYPPPLRPSVRLSICPRVRVCPDDISCTAQPFLIKLGMVVYYHEAECRAEKLVRYLQCQGYSEGLNKQSLTISTISSKVLVHLPPNLAR